jgi:superfamily I DNA and/or RNA helicase
MDERRINVTLTRSKYLLIIVGNGDTLGSNEVWNNFLEFVENQKCYYEIHKETDSDKIL